MVGERLSDFRIQCAHPFQLPMLSGRSEDQLCVRLLHAVEACGGSAICR